MVLPLDQRDKKFQSIHQSWAMHPLKCVIYVRVSLKFKVLSVIYPNHTHLSVHPDTVSDKQFITGSVRQISITFLSFPPLPFPAFIHLPDKDARNHRSNYFTGWWMGTSYHSVCLTWYFLPNTPAAVEFLISVSFLAGMNFNCQPGTNLGTCICRLFLLLQETTI